MSDCPQELCRNWTGQGCICAVMDLEPSLIDIDQYDGIEDDDG